MNSFFNELEVFFELLTSYEVPFVILLAANAYYLSRKVDHLNHWTYIRQTCPELCTLHSLRLFPDDKIFVCVLTFLHEKTCILSGNKVRYNDLITAIATFTSSRAGVLYPHVLRLLKEERTPQIEGYKNILNGILSIRLGCVIEGDSVVNLKLDDEFLSHSSEK